VIFKFWELLENASEVALVPKNIFFLEILNFVQSFVECKVSLADGMYTTRSQQQRTYDELLIKNNSRAINRLNRIPAQLTSSLLLFFR
jgi:hypothetical protein